MMIESEFDETCTIRHVTSITRDTYGSPSEAVSTTTTVCKFIPAMNTREVIGTGERFRVPPKLILPPTVSVIKGDTISTTEPEYSGTYNVTSIIPAKTRYGLSTGFILCELYRYE